MILNSNIFASWLQFFSHPNEVTELEKANNNALVTIKNGEKDIENEVIDSLMDFPTSLIFFGEVENNGMKVMIKVVHHFFKKTSTGFPFRGEADEMAFALLGLDNETLVVEVPYGLFTKGTKPAMATPHLKDFINATGHQAKFDLLSAVDPKGITNQTLRKAKTPRANLYP